jgi:hypothetical protein
MIVKETNDRNNDDFGGIMKKFDNDVEMNDMNDKIMADNSQTLGISVQRISSISVIFSML